MGRKSIVALGVLLAGCAGAARTAPDQGYTPLRWVPPPRVHALIGQRDRIELTSAQVNRLDSIGVALQVGNRPLNGRLAELQAEVSPRRGPSEEQTRGMRPILEQLRDRNQAATEAVRAALTEAQRTRVCEVFRPDRRERARELRRAREARDRRLPRNMQMDTVDLTARSPWPWCQTAAAADSARRGR